MSMKDMDTGSLLNLFEKEDEAGKSESKAPQKGLAAILADLPSLEETEAQYHAEYNIDRFKSLLKKKN